MQPRELLQPPASSKAGCWSQGRALSELLQPQGSGSVPCKRPHALTRSWRGCKIGSREGSFPQIPAGCSGDRLQLARSPGA